MSDAPQNSSFIPKRTAAQGARRSRKQSFFLLSIVSTACLVAAPVASAAVYAYKLYTERLYSDAVATLDSEIASFSQADMAKVLEFDGRLKEVTKLLDSHVSLGKVLTILETTTIENLGFQSLGMDRTDSDSVTVTGEIITGGFDPAIFQRIAYTNTTSITDGALSNITYTPTGAETDTPETVTLSGTFVFDTDAIRYTPTADPVPVTEAAVIPPAASAENLGEVELISPDTL